jgi:hypothetical protein
VLYLSLVNFDYSYNMKVVVAVGICDSFLWLLWFIRNRKAKAFAWKVVVAVWTTYLVLPLELLDFPPFFGLMDAHALWHLLTVPLNYLFCVFIRDSIAYDEQQVGKSKTA